MQLDVVCAEVNRFLHVARAVEEIEAFVISGHCKGKPAGEECARCLVKWCAASMGTEAQCPSRIDLCHEAYHIVNDSIGGDHNLCQ